MCRIVYVMVFVVLIMSCLSRCCTIVFVLCANRFEGRSQLLSSPFDSLSSFDPPSCPSNLPSTSTSVERTQAAAIAACTQQAGSSARSRQRICLRRRDPLTPMRRVVRCVIVCTELQERQDCTTHERTDAAQAAQAARARLELLVGARAHPFACVCPLLSAAAAVCRPSTSPARMLAVRWSSWRARPRLPSDMRICARSAKTNAGSSSSGGEDPCTRSHPRVSLTSCV